MICRHINDVQRQKDGFIDVEEVANFLNRRENRHMEAKIDDVERIARGDGGNSKMRFEWGGTYDGRRAWRTSQGHSKGSGATSECLRQIQCPGMLAHGTSLDNAFNIGQQGLRRVERLHIHLGVMIDQQPVGIRSGS